MTSGVLGLLDDIATLMDDVASMAKIATKKTVGILADDLAVNAEKASGFLSTRELPVLWKLTKGSLLNKVIILPAVFLLSVFLPIAIIPILLLGGTYLSFEGALKIYEFLFHRGEKKRARKLSEMSNSELEGYEKKKIKSAVLIDFILSIEIIIIALGTVIDEPLKIQIPVVTFVAILATIGVYGVVALLVRVDDTGYRLIALNKSDFANKLGRLLVRTLPIIIRVLNVVGTLAMLLVGGGIFVHNVQIIHHYFHDIPMILAEFTVGLFSGIVFLTIYLLIKKITSVKA